MAVDVAPLAPPSAGPLHRLIRRTRILLRTTQAASGLALTAGLLLGAAALVVALDLSLPLLQLPYGLAHGCDSGLRLASLCLVVAPPAVAFLVGVLFPLFHRLTAGRVARRIEAHIPGIHNRLVSCIDLEARGRATASPVFYRRLVGEALERIRGFHPSRVLDFRSLRRAGLAAFVGAAAFAVVWCLFSNQMPPAFARIFRPFDDIPPVGAAAYTVEPRGGDYLREEKIDFAAAITRGQAASLTLELRAGDGTTQAIPLDPVRDDPSSFRLELDTVSIGQAFQDGFDYRVYGGGTWSAKYPIHLGPRPLITAVDTAVYYPAYMGVPEAHPAPREASEIIGPEGGEIEVILQAEGQIREGEIQRLKPTFQVDQTFAMHEEGPGRWVGRMPLVGRGVFRAELRNEQKAANKPMSELRYSSVKDLPPQIVLQQPDAERTLSQPRAIPITVAAYDDYGLADLTLFYRTDESKPYQSRVIHHFEKPERARTVVAALDEVKELKPGETLHYHVQASDRKHQAARAPDKDATVTIKPDDPNAADRKEAALDRTQDTFHDRLAQLIAEQKKVRAAVEKLTAQYAPMAEKVRKDQEAAAPKPSADPTKPPPPQEGPKLDPETAKQMAELQKQLAELAKEQDKNAQAASQLNNDLANAAAQADRLKSLPQPLVQQMQALQQAFEQTAVHGMRNLTQQFNQGANPQAGAPNLPDVHQKSDRLSKDLEGLKDRMDAIDEARKAMRDDLAKALADLQRRMLNENGKLSERDLQELRDFLARMREQMKDLQTQEENLLDAAAKGGDLKDLEQKQADLDKQMRKLLDAARKLLDAKRDPRRRPNFPDEPYTPDDAKDEDPLDMPALGGPKQVPDPRYEKKRRPVEEKPGDKDDPDAKRNDLESHQNDRLRDLDVARKSMAADQQTLEQMLHGLEQALQKSNPKGRPNSGAPNEADEAMAQLQDMLQSPAMRAAREMLGRMRRAQAAQARRPGPQGQNQAPTPSQSQASQTGANPTVPSAELASLPLSTQQAILKLPPRVREELLQGLREQGPDGYGPFIEDYFKRLTESKSP